VGYEPAGLGGCWWLVDDDFEILQLWSAWACLSRLGQTDRFAVITIVVVVVSGVGALVHGLVPA
jgi:hypothetical protein